MNEITEDIMAERKQLVIYSLLYIALRFRPDQKYRIYFTHNSYPVIFIFVYKRLFIKHNKCSNMFMYVLVSVLPQYMPR